MTASAVYDHSKIVHVKTFDMESESSSYKKPMRFSNVADYFKDDEVEPHKIIKSNGKDFISPTISESLASRKYFKKRVQEQTPPKSETESESFYTP